MSWGKVFIWLLFLLFPLGQLIRLPLGIPGVSIYVHDLVLLAIWIWLIVSLRGRILDLFKKGIGKKILIFSSIAFLSWLVGLFRGYGSNLLSLGYLVRWIGLIAPYFAVSKLMEEGEVSRDEIIKWLRRSVLFFVLLGWVQYLFFPDLTHLKYFGWDDHYYRLTGTILDPNFMGIILVLGLGIEFMFKKTSFFRKLFFLITLAFTYSRSSWLAWLVLLIVLAVQRILVDPVKKDPLFLLRILIRPLKAIGIIFWLLASMMIFYFLPRPQGEGGNLLRTASTQARFISWENSWQIIKKNPVFGVGFNNYRLAQKQEGFLDEDWQIDHAGAGADNSFLFVWATTGILGLIAFLCLVFSWEPIWLFLPLFVHSLFNNSLFYPWILIIVWVIGAISKDSLGAGDGI